MHGAHLGDHCRICVPFCLWWLQLGWPVLLINNAWTHRPRALASGGLIGWISMTSATRHAAMSPVKNNKDRSAHLVTVTRLREDTARRTGLHMKQTEVKQHWPQGKLACVDSPVHPVSHSKF